MEFLLNYQLLQTSQFNYQAIFRLRSIASHLKTLLMGTIIILEKLTGVPDAQWNVGLDASSTSGFTTSFSKVGRIPMNDQNSNTPKTYSLLDIKASYTFTILKVLKTELSRINNAGNTKYAASILPNAVGFGNAQPRAYYPKPGIIMEG
jgi:iron complex outermembrane receptor protein